jgi:hypothetical protein
MANTETTIKVFRLDDCTWWVGADLESCITDAMRDYQLPRKDVADADAHELSDEELDRLNFVEGDDPINTDGTTGGTLTFARRSRAAWPEEIAFRSSLPAQNTNKN